MSAPGERVRPDRETWNERYRESTRVWSGEPNTELVRQVAGLDPAASRGRALDLGCGEGADAVWLARHGWLVTAVDVSDVALERAARHAADAGVAGEIDFQRRDLVADFPPGDYDLVSAQFLYPRDAAAREGVLRAAARAVSPGGILLVEGHSEPPDPERWRERHPDGELRFPKPQEVLDSLLLEPEEWEVLVCEEHERVRTGPDGARTVRTDSTLKLRRR